ncbi:MAG: MraY family glycosyltransferase [Phycisphaerales bacterium]|jgi:UDP-GlcNAc:undecaprenyl-phosphate GlcNAc-1-phosphate transferase
MDTSLSVFLGSALLAILLTPLVIRLANRIGAVDQPGVRKVHKHPIARIGGVAIFLSSMTALAAVLFGNNATGEAFRAMQRNLTAVLIGAGFIFVVGLVDDLRGLPAKIKLLAELAAAGGLCLVGVRIGDIAITEQLVVHTGGWGCLLTILWIVGVTNAVNISDGLDGLAAGVSAIACGVIAVFSFHHGDAVMVVFATAMLGSLCGFLVFNFNPAKVFMGDCGSLFLGFTIAAASVMCVAESTALVGLTLPALALGIPIFDTLFSMVRRFLDRRSMFAPDRSHFHHRLLDMGLHQRHAVMMIYLATLLAAGCGLFMMISEDAMALLVFGCVLVLLMLLFRVVGVVHVRKSLACLQRKYAARRIEREDQRVFENLELHFRETQDAEQWREAIREAASDMDFAWVSLKTTHAGVDDEERLWRSPKIEQEAGEVVTMTIPFHDGDPATPHEFEIAIQAHGSLETAGRRVMLFGRLLDEHRVAMDS